MYRDQPQLWYNYLIAETGNLLSCLITRDLQNIYVQNAVFKKEKLKVKNWFNMSETNHIWRYQKSMVVEMLIFIGKQGEVILKKN